MIEYTDAEAEEGRANARLIAAAPAMLNLLKFIRADANIQDELSGPARTDLNERISGLVDRVEEVA